MIDKMICWSMESVNLWREILRSDETVKSWQVTKDNDRDRYEIEVTFKS